MERDDVRAVENLVGEMVRRFIDIDRARENDVRTDSDVCRVAVAIVEARCERRIVETDDRISFLLERGNELREIMLSAGEVHFIEAHDVELVRMLRSIDQKLGKARVGAPVDEILHVDIAQDIAVVHPGRADREETDPLFRDPECFAVEADEAGLARAAHACQDDEPGGFDGNMEIDEILLVIEKAGAAGGVRQAVDEILLRESGRFVPLPVLSLRFLGRRFLLRCFLHVLGCFFCGIFGRFPGSLFRRFLGDFLHLFGSRRFQFLHRTLSCFQKRCFLYLAAVLVIFLFLCFVLVLITAAGAGSNFCLHDLLRLSLHL